MTTEEREHFINLIRDYAVATHTVGVSIQEKQARVLDFVEVLSTQRDQLKSASERVLRAINDAYRHRNDHREINVRTMDALMNLERVVHRCVLRLHEQPTHDSPASPATVRHDGSVTFSAQSLDELRNGGPITQQELDDYQVRFINAWSSAWTDPRPANNLLADWVAHPLRPKIVRRRIQNLPNNGEL